MFFVGIDDCYFILKYPLGALSSAEAPAGYPYKNGNNRKNRKREASTQRGLRGGESSGSLC